MKKKTVQHPKSSAGTHPKIENVNIKSVVVLATPDALHQELPLTPKAVRTVSAARRTIAAILDGKDPRQLAIVGPCSLHNLAAAEDYAARLHRLAKELDETLCIVMRVYFEKPRSILGWKGLINDPYLDDTFKMEDGLSMARAFLLRLAERGLAAATEVLDTLTPQYLGDLFAWSAIGARTAESQTHREIASGISTPVGFKNATDGSLEAAINGIKTARRRTPLPRRHGRRSSGDLRHRRQPPFAYRASRRRPGQLRFGQHRRVRGRAGGGGSSLRDRGRLQPREFPQEARAPGARPSRPPVADRKREPLDSRLHAGELPRVGKPAHPRRQEQASPRDVGHRSLH